MNVPHPGWIQWLEDQWPRLILWTDLAVDQMLRAVRIVRPSEQRRYEKRWLTFEYAMLSASILRNIVRRGELFSNDDPESDSVWICSRHRDFSTVATIFNNLSNKLKSIEILSPALDDALSDVTSLLNSAVGKPLYPLPGFACVLDVRRDFIIWLDQLNYAYRIRSLRVAGRTWKMAQRRHRKKKQILAVRAAHPRL